MSQHHIPVSSLNLSRKSSTKSNKRRSLELPAILSGSKTNRRFSVQAPSLNGVNSALSTIRATSSKDVGTDENGVRVIHLVRRANGNGDTNLSPRAHKLSRNMESDDTTGFWSRRLSAQRRAVAVRQPSPSASLTPTTSEPLSSKPGIGSMKPQLPRSGSPLGDSSSPSSPSFDKTLPKLPPSNTGHRTLRRKGTIPPRPPSKDGSPDLSRHERVTTRRDRRISALEPIPTISSPVAKSMSHSNSAPSLLSVQPVPKIYDFLSAPPPLTKETRPSSPRKFSPIKLGKLVSGLNKKAANPQTRGVGSSSMRTSDQSVADPEPDAPLSEQEKQERERRRKTGLEQIVVAIRGDQYTYTQSEMAEANDVLEQLRKLKRS